MLREDLQKALKESMLAKDTQRVSAVRLIIAGMKEKDVDARGKGLKEASEADLLSMMHLKEASEADLLSMMQNMIKQRRDSIDMYLKGNRQDLADKEQAEINVIETFLPKQMSDDEVLAAVKAAIAATGATSMKDMGKVMGELKGKYAGQMDFGKVSGLIKTMF